MRALADQERSPPQQVARLAHALGIDVGLREGPAAQERGQLVGVDRIVLRLAAVDQLEVEGVAEDEVDLLRSAEVGEPVPGEHALTADDQAVAKRGQRVEHCRRGRGHRGLADEGAGAVEDAQREGPGVQVNATVESVRLVVKAHHGLRWGGPACRAPIVVDAAQPRLKIPRRDKVRLDPATCWDEPPAHPIEAMMSIQWLKLTGAAVLVLQASTSLQAAPAA